MSIKVVCCLGLTVLIPTWALSTSKPDWVVRAAILSVALLPFAALEALRYLLRDFRGINPQFDLTPAERARAQLSAARFLGPRPRDYDPAVIQSLTGPTNTSWLRAEGWLRAYERALDRGKLADAERALIRAWIVVPWAGPPPNFWRDIQREVAYFAAKYWCDPQLGRFLQQFFGMHAGYEYHTPARTEAVLLQAEGKPSEALIIAHRGLNSVRESVVPAQAMFDGDLLRQLTVELPLEFAECEKSRSATSVVSLTQTPVRQSLLPATEGDRADGANYYRLNRPRQWHRNETLAGGEIPSPLRRDQQLTNIQESMLRAYYYCMDTEDYISARRYFFRALAIARCEPKFAEPLVFAESAFFMSFVLRDSISASALLELCTVSDEPSAASTRAIAATLLAQGLPDQAYEVAEEAIRLMEDAPRVDTWSLEVEWLRVIQRDATYQRTLSEQSAMTT